MAVGSNRYVTGRRPRDENNTVRFRQSAENRESREEHAAEQRRLWRHSLQGGASVGTPWLPEEDMGQEEVPYLNICLSVYLPTNNKQRVPFENKMRDMFFIKKCFVRSLNFVLSLWLYNSFKYFYITLIFIFNINDLFERFQVLLCNINYLTSVICLHTGKWSYIYYMICNSIVCR